MNTQTEAVVTKENGSRFTFFVATGPEETMRQDAISRYKRMYGIMAAENIASVVFPTSSKTALRSAPPEPR